MAREDYDIVGSFNNQRVPGFDAERTINMFEYLDPRGKKGKVLLPTAGLNKVLEQIFVLDGYRAQFVFNGTLFNVVGSGVYALDALLNPTLLFTLPTTQGYVGIDANTHQVIFVDGVQGWIWDVNTSTATHIVDPNFPTQPIDVVNLDGFFYVAQGNSPTFNQSAINNGLVWPALGFANITTHPGNIVGLRVLHRRLFVFSSNFTEVWENAGAATFALRPNRSLLLEVGAVSRWGIVTGFDRMFFLSQNKQGLGQVVEVTGTQAFPVSNSALDYAIQNFSVVSDITTMIYRENGVVFFRMNFTNVNITYVYNVTMSTPESPKWHEEQMLNGDRHVAQTNAYFNNTVYFGHYSQSIMYEVDDSHVTNAGEVIRRARIPKMFVPPAYNRVRCNRFHLDLLQGKVDNVTQNTAPVVYLSLSPDSGQTYGSQLPAKMGQLGQRSFRTVWRKLAPTKRGQAFQPYFQFFNEIPFVILGAAWDYEVLPE